MNGKRRDLPRKTVRFEVPEGDRRYVRMTRECWFASDWIVGSRIVLRVEREKTYRRDGWHSELAGWVLRLTDMFVRIQNAVLALVPLYSADGSHVKTEDSKLMLSASGSCCIPVIGVGRHKRSLEENPEVPTRKTCANAVTIRIEGRSAF